MTFGHPCPQDVTWSSAEVTTKSASVVLSPTKPDYPSWLACLKEEETVWEVEEDDEFVFCSTADCVMKDCESQICCACQMNFDFFEQMFHCAVCGKTLCGGCSGYWTMLPHLGHYGRQRTCKSCHLGCTGNRALCPGLLESGAQTRRRRSITKWLAAWL
eukprot:EG_transcript_11631